MDNDIHPNLTKLDGFILAQAPEDGHGDETHAGDDGTHAATQVPEDAAPETTEVPVDVSMILLMWLTFAIVLALLYKFGFKHMMDNIEGREQRIRESLDEADRIRDELSKMDEKCDAMIQEAEAKSKDILAEARNAADEGARSIREKANEESRIMLENARREIAEAEDAAKANLRAESTDLAIQLASRIVEANLDDERNRKLADKLIAEL